LTIRPRSRSIFTRVGRHMSQGTTMKHHPNSNVIDLETIGLYEVTLFVNGGREEETERSPAPFHNSLRDLTELPPFRTLA
jgi:hypothetical protein